MNQKARLFVAFMVVLGAFQLVVSSSSWSDFHGRPFVVCFVTAGVFAYLGAKRGSRTSGAQGFSLSLPFVLLSMVQLSPAEAVLVGCFATLVQSLRNTSQGFQSSVRANWYRIGVALGVQATAISAAVFALNALLPRSAINAEDGIVVRLIVGAGTLFVANTLPLAAAVRLEGSGRLGTVWRESFWSFPYYLVSGAVALLLDQGPTSISPQTAFLVAPSLWLAWRYYRTQKVELASKQQHAHQMAALHLRAIEGLALAMEARENLNTRGHLRRVQVYSLGIGKAMGIKGEQLDALHAGALLHDIGKLAVPEHILSKPGKLTPEEFARMKVHPLVGAEIVEQVEFPYPVAPIVRAHHEKWDGSGYPLGLKGEEIPLGARILSAVDCLDALTSDREYRKGMPLKEAMEYITAQAGRHFDPRVVTALQQNYVALDLQANAGVAEVAPKMLSTNAVVQKGASPDAGLDHVAAGTGQSPTDFLSSIAAARREENLVRDLLGKSGTLDIHQLMPRLSEVLSGIVPYDAMAIFVRQGSSLRVEFSAGVNRAALAQLDVVMGEGLTGWVARNRQPVVNGNPSVDPGFWCDLPGGLNSALSIPMDGENELLGVLNLYRRDKDAFTRDDLRILNAVTPQAALALANSMKYRDVQRMAKIDPVTNMGNADLFQEMVDDHLVTVKRAGQSLTVLVLELEQYQSVLVREGQAHTDKTLARLAEELRLTCRQGDHLARLGPATFGFAFPGMDQRSLGIKVQRLEQLAEGNRISFGALSSFSFGGAVYPADGDTVRHLMVLARRRAQPPTSAEWISSVRSLTTSLGESVAPVGTPPQITSPSN
ncbi:MAG: HD domain-containing phosphohydrolase [Acidobacteriota bacterium]